MLHPILSPTPSLARLTSFILACILALAAAGCSSKDPPPPPSTVLPPPTTPPTVQDTSPPPPPAPVVEISTPADEYTPNGVNPWNQASTRPQSSFSLAPSAQKPADMLAQITAAIDGEKKLPDPTTVLPEVLVAAFRYAPPTNHLQPQTEVIPSPFDPARQFVRVTVAAPTSEGATPKTVAQNALLTVQWNKTAIKRYRLIGFQNHDHATPRVAPAALAENHQTTAFYEIELRENAPQDLGKVSLTYLPGSGDPSTLSPAKADAPITYDPTLGLEFSSDDTRFALAVATFAEVLQASPETKTWKISAIEALAVGSAADDPARVAFAALITRSRAFFPPEEVIPPPEPTKPTKKPRATTDIHPADKDIIVRALTQHTQDVKDCYKRIIMKHGNRSGRLVLDFTITEAGQVESVSVDNDDIGNNFGQCAADRARRWKFPPLHKATRIIKPWSF